MQQLGAQPLIERGDGDEQHPLGVESMFLPWLVKLFDALPGSQALLNIGPKVTVDFAPSGIPTLSSHLPYVATVRKNERITALKHFQDVRHVELQLDDPLEYFPGDVAVLHPANDPVLVSNLLSLLGWQEFADIPLSITANRPEVRLPPSFISGTITTLRDLLTNHLDIVTPPRPWFFASLSESGFLNSHHPDYDLHIQKLQELSSGEGLDLYLSYCWRPRRTPFEILSDFPLQKSILQNSVHWLFDLFPLQRARDYSISSSMLAHGRNTIHITAALVRYTRQMGLVSRTRTGICSRWIENLSENQQIRLSTRKGNWKSLLHGSKNPLILIAAGTGIAPMRAMIHHVASLEEQRRIVLFFGCRFLEWDYIYKNEWYSIKERGFPLEVFATGSRDDLTGSRRYVDFTLLQQSDLVKNLLVEENATIFIAGNSKLPALVKETIVKITGDARLVNELVKNQRLNIECWS